MCKDLSITLNNKSKDRDPTYYIAFIYLKHIDKEGTDRVILMQCDR